MSGQVRRQAADIVVEQLRRRGYKGRVAAKCVDCTYDETAPGSWRAQVEACTVTACPLWEVRPRTRSVPAHALEATDDE